MLYQNVKVYFSIGFLLLTFPLAKNFILFDCKHVLRVYYVWSVTYDAKFQV